MACACEEIFGTDEVRAACKRARNLLRRSYVSMKSRAILTAAAFALLSTNIARAQDAPPAPTAPQVAAQAPASPASAQEPAPSVPVFTGAFLDEGPYLGIHVEDVTRDNAAGYKLSGEPRGVGVKEVVKGSPAEQAGIRTGDVIVRFDGEAVTSVRKLTRLVSESAPKHAARVGLIRNGSEQEVSATLADRPHVVPALEGRLMPGFDSEDMKLFGERLKENSEEWQLKGDALRKKLEELQRANPGGSAPLMLGTSRRIGVTTSPLGRQLADYFGVSGGVLINSVEASSPADKAGLKAGDIITEADGSKVESAGDLVSALGKKESGEVTLTVVRDKKQRSVRVTPERRESDGIRVRPGSFSIEGPVAAFELPRITVPGVLADAPSIGENAPDVYVSLPQVHVSTPRIHISPLRLKAPRIRLFPDGERVL